MIFLKDCFYSNFDSSSKEELLNIMSQGLIKNNFVTEDYFYKVMEREKKYPTGIQAAVGFAIPHTNPEYVMKESISISILSNPIIFHDMSDPEKTVSVKIVFLLAFNKNEKHLESLQKIIELVTDTSLINNLIDYDKEKQYEFLNQYFTKSYQEGE
jgi:PTS system galactitol-specific IIA component